VKGPICIQVKACCTKGQFRKKTISVESLRKNAWGLFDMHGNVEEWCQDWYEEYPTGRVDNPTGPTTASNRVIRGGQLDQLRQVLPLCLSLLVRPGQCVRRSGLPLVCPRSLKSQVRKRQVTSQVSSEVI